MNLGNPFQIKYCLFVNLSSNLNQIPNSIHPFKNYSQPINNYIIFNDFPLGFMLN